jgi:hypothetical protein
VDLFFGAPRAAPDENRQILRGHQEESPAHARRLDEGPLAERRLDVRDLQVPKARPEGGLRGGKELCLRPGHVACDRDELLCRGAFQQMVPRQPKGDNLIPGYWKWNLCGHFEPLFMKDR